MTLFADPKYPFNEKQNSSKYGEGFSQPSTLDEVTKQMKYHIKSNIEYGLYSNALFFADKVKLK